MKKRMDFSFLFPFFQWPMGKGVPGLAWGALALGTPVYGAPIQNAAPSFSLSPAALGILLSSILLLVLGLVWCFLRRREQTKLQGCQHTGMEDGENLRRQEEEKAVTIQALKVLSKAGPITEIVHDLGRVLMDWTQCDAMGLRLKKGEDFPYFETQGFSEDFIRMENSLCAVDENREVLRDEAGRVVLECLCGTVLCGRRDVQADCFTPFGSFWTNHSSALLSEGCLDCLVSPRARCIQKGYASMVLIPLRHDEEVIGLLQLNGRKAHLFDAGQIALLEGLSSYLAIAVQHRKNTQALTESEARFRMLFEHMSSGVSVFEAVDEGEDFVFVDLNPVGEKLGEIKREEALGKRFSLLFPAVRKIGLLQVFQQVWRSGKPAYHPLTLYQDDRMQRWMENRVFRLPNGQIAALYDDSTEKHKAEEQLHFQATLLDQIRDYVTATDLEGRITYVNRASCENLGKVPEELLNSHVAALGEDTTQGAGQQEIVQKTRENGHWEGEVVNLTTQGEAIVLYCRTRLLYNEKLEPQGMVGISTDITARKKAEKTLQESEERLRAVTENMPVLLDAFDGQGRVLFWNKECERVTGYSAEEMVGNPDALKMLYPDPAYFQWVLATIRHKEGDFHNLEFTLSDKNGQEHIIAWSNISKSVPIAGWDSWAVGLDVTEQRRIEGDLRRLATAIEQAAEVVVITDDHGRILYVNPAFENTTGYSREEVLNGNPRILKSGRHDARFYQEMWATLTQGKTWTGRIVNRKKDGAFYTEESTISPVRDDKGRIVNYVGVKRDITAELELEQQYRQAQKMEAIGQLAGGIAHDFNNILAAILGYSQLAFDDSQSVEVRESLQEVLKAGNRARTLVQQILTFSRKQQMQPETLDLNGVIEEAAKMLGRVIGEHIRFEISLKPGLHWVEADRGMVEQVLMNLAVNGRDAMEDGGTLIIATDNVTLSPEFCQEHSWAQPGSFARIEVSDTGKGMSPEMATRIFEPFFSTKKEGEGTGLGLSTVYGIIQQHQGLIHVESSEGEGARFFLYFPATQKPVHNKNSAYEEAQLKGSETVLIVEDDEMVRHIGKRILEREGYQVLLAENGQEGVLLFEKEKAQIDIVVMDVVMPVMGGMEAYEKIKAIRWDTPILFASGYSESVIDHDFILKEGLTLIQKPFQKQTFLAALRRLLDDPEK